MYWRYDFELMCYCVSVLYILESSIIFVNGAKNAGGALLILRLIRNLSILFTIASRVELLYS